MATANQVPLPTSSDAELPHESAGGGATLESWRRKAGNVALVVVAVAHLPVIILGVFGHAPNMGSFLKAIGVTVYLILAAAALFQRVKYRTRLLISIVALYAALALANVAFPYGPYAQVGAIAMPVFALVLLGNRAGRNAIVASIVIIIAAPFVGRAAPGVMYTLGIEPAQMTDPPGLLWFRITVRLACLVGLMVLLESFYRFLSDALAARIAAQRKVERGLQERRHLEREMAAISDEERRHLGQELHDGVCQQLTAALLRCQALQRRLYRGGILSSPDFETLSSLLAETIDDAHNIARGLCPLEPSPDALAPALRVLTKRIQQISGLRCEFLVTGDVRVAAPEAAQHLYRIAQEALSNVARHAHANHVAVELRGTEGELILQVDDDGVGLPAALAVGGMGLRTMSYRAQMLAGELTVAPMPGKGTRVTCRMPRPNGGSSGQDESGEGRWIRAA